MKESVVENLKRKYKGVTARTLRTAKLIAIMTVFMSAILFSPEEAYAKTTKITMGKGQKVETEAVTGKWHFCISGSVVPCWGRHR